MLRVHIDLMSILSKIRKDEQNIYTNNTFRCFNAIFRVCRISIGRPATMKDIRLLFSNVPWLSSVLRVVNDSHVMKQDFWRCSDRHSSSKTVTGLDSLAPCVIEMCVAGISAFLEPSTAPGATCAFSCLIYTTFGTLIVAHCRYTSHRGGVCVGMREWNVRTGSISTSSLWIDGQNAVYNSISFNDKIQPQHMTQNSTPAELRLQAWMPSVHVWSNCVSPRSPHFLNQAPPRAQQLRLPDSLVKPHLRHTELTVVDVIIPSGGVEVPERTDFGDGLMLPQ